MAFCAARLSTFSSSNCLKNSSARARSPGSASLSIRALAFTDVIQLAPAVLNRLAVVERREPVLHTGDVFDQTFLAAHQMLQRPCPVLAAIVRLQSIEPEQLGQLARVARTAHSVAKLPRACACTLAYRSYIYFSLYLATLFRVNN